MGSMKKNSLNKTYWESRYEADETGWDIGYVSTPIKEYIDQLNDKSIRILIPGAGNGYEAEYLWSKGFKNVFVLDIAEQPLENLTQRISEFPKTQLIHNDFFKLKERFDLILEQTFFCALHPKLRKNYVEKMHELLSPKGKLTGLLFNFELTELGPPFGGNITEYKLHFEDRFEIKILEKSYNSIKAREGKELFFIFEKKSPWH